VKAAATKVSIALPTGALMKGSLRILARAGLARLGAAEVGRQLLVDRAGVRVILVRPADVPAYVDHGAADLGIVGKDILWETPGAHYELVDLRFGGCRMVFAVPLASKLDGPETWPPQLRVATKYPRTASAWFEARGQSVEVVQLRGSVELAPSAGLSDGVVDVVATGSTLRANRLCEVATIAASTARLVVNVASMKTRSAAITELAAALRRTVEERRS